MQRTSFVLRPTPPYDFELTAGYASNFRGRYGANIFEDGAYRRLLDIGGQLTLAVVRSTGTSDSPRLEVKLKGNSLDDAAADEAQRQIIRLLGIEGDLTPFYDMALLDSHLAPFARGLRGLHLPLAVSTYEALILAILGQQISTHVARMLRTLLIETYGSNAQIEGETYYTFPRPEKVGSVGADGLRAIKFSVRKSEYIIDISSRVASGELDLDGLRHQSSNEAIEKLTSIRGVGPWTAHWLLVRALGHSDGFPHGDLALQRTMGLLVNGGVPMSAQDALDYSERWSPYRSYVTTYLFAATRSGRFDEFSKADEFEP